MSTWTKQGVLLLNRALSFEKDLTLNKRLKFWKPVTDIIIDKLLNRGKPLIVMLWGGPANTMENFPIHKDEGFKKENIHILRSSHPSNMGNAKIQELWWKIKKWMPLSGANILQNAMKF